MIKNKLRIKIRTLSNDIANKWIVSMVLSGISVFFTGIYAVLSPYVYIDFKQPDIMFILFFFLVVFIVGCVFVFYEKSCKKRVVILIFPFLSIGGLILYYEKIIIHDLNSIEGPKLIILYPDKFDDLKLKTEWERSINEIPDSIENQVSRIKLLKIPTRFTENIDDSLLLNEINSRYDIVGYIVMHEIKNAVMLELKLPAIESIKNVGLSWAKSGYSESELEKKLEINAGYGALHYEYSLAIRKSGPHIGTYSGVSNIGFNLSPRAMSLDEIRSLRKLPVADVFDVPANNLTRGLYFSANMVSIAYLSLAGYPESYCSSLEKYIEFDFLNPEFDFLKKLNPLIVENCLFDKGDKLILRITENLNDKDKNAIHMRIIKRILSSSDIDGMYVKSRVFKKGLIDKVIRVREFCGLKSVGYEYYKAANCLSDVMNGRGKIKIDEPVLKYVFSQKAYEFLDDAFFSSIISMDYRKIQGNIVESDRISSLMGGGGDDCGIKYLYLFYSILQVSDFNVINKSEENIRTYINEVAGVFYETSRMTQCKSIEVFNVNFSELVSNGENRRIFAKEYKNTLDLLGKGVRVKDFLSQAVKLIFPYLDKNSKLSKYIKTKNEYNEYEDVKLIFDYFENIGFSLLNYGNIDGAFENDILNIVEKFAESQGVNYNSVLNYRLDDDGLEKIDNFFNEGDVSSTLRPYLLRFYEKSEKLKDPLISEGFRYMYDLYSGENIDNSVLPEPLVFKNPIHMIKLYFYFKKVSHNSEQLDAAMNLMLEMYPGEVDGLVYKHFEMLKDHLDGNYNRAKNRAADLIPYIAQDMKSFYRFYIESVQYDSSNIKCNGKLGSKSRWSEYAVNKYRPVIINHMLMNEFGLSIWEKEKVNDDSWLTAETNAPDYDKRFKNSLFRYIEGYYYNNEEGRNAEDEPLDFMLLAAILDSRQHCGL